MGFKDAETQHEGKIAKLQVPCNDTHRFNNELKIVLC